MVLIEAMRCVNFCHSICSVIVVKFWYYVAYYSFEHTYTISSHTMCVGRYIDIQNYDSDVQKKLDCFHLPHGNKIQAQCTWSLPSHHYKPFTLPCLPLTLCQSQVMLADFLARVREYPLVFSFGSSLQISTIASWLCCCSRVSIEPPNGILLSVPNWAQWSSSSCFLLPSQLIRNF